MKLTPAFAAACLILGAPGAHAQDPALGRNLAATCANCHGTHGHSLGGNESLAGEPREKLLRKLEAFKSGEKPATIMHQIARGYTPEQLALIVDFFASQKAHEVTPR
ncbi:MAG: cytochrome C [Rhodocyclaceae bacterium]|nr:cytochrome C [Rhodocyclaceae bacterium]